MKALKLLVITGSHTHLPPDPNAPQATPESDFAWYCVFALIAVVWIGYSIYRRRRTGSWFK